MIDLTSRITPKFRNSTNFKNILEFLNTNDTTSLDILQQANNMDSEYGFILDEIGKTLGVYPRPLIRNEIDGNPTYFILDSSPMDSVPMTNDSNIAYRELSNEEYSKVLRAYAQGIDFNGTIQEWEDIIFAITGASSSFDSRASVFGIVIHKDLDFVEKAIIEYILQYNLLTVSIDYVGTTADDTTPLLLDVAPLDEATFIEPWQI